MLYTSLENKKIKNIKKLYTKKYRDEYNESIQDKIGDYEYIITE